VSSIGFARALLGFHKIKSVPNQIANRQSQRRAAIGFVVFALLTLGSIFLLRWQPHADFDVTGVLWLMQNIVPLIIFSVCFALATGAGIAWLRGRSRERAQRDRPL